MSFEEFMILVEVEAFIHDTKSGSKYWSLAETFIQYVTEMKRRFGRIVVILGRKIQYRSKALRKMLGRDGNIRFVYLTRESLYLSMIEKHQRHTKYRLLVSEYYPAFADMRGAVSEYFRTSKLKLDMYAYLDRWAALILKNF